MTLEVHPLAALFPMMTDDELQDLADDIRENGLLHPIVLDADGVLIDGRNRLRACEIAEVEPQFESLNGHDATAFIVSANLARRNLTIGQRAMALALIYPEERSKGGRGNKSDATKAAENSGFSYRRLAQARVVVRHSRALADSVMANRISLDAALGEVAEDLRKAASTDDQMAELRAKAPDVADLVAEERLTLEAGIAELRQRERLEEEAVDAGMKAVKRVNDLTVQTAMVEKAVVINPDILADLDLDAVAAAVARLVALKGGHNDQQQASSLSAG